jgi:serine O-acetyltransferase
LSNGFHALVCYRVGHLLWQAGRTGLAYYMQSTVSRKYSADMHPASRLGRGIYLRVGSGVVIGETATVGNDVSILEGAVKLINNLVFKSRMNASKCAFFGSK